MTPEGAEQVRQIEVSLRELLTRTKQIKEQRNKCLDAAERLVDRTNAAEFALAAVQSEPRAFDATSFLWGSGVGAAAVGGIGVAILLAFGGGGGK